MLDKELEKDRALYKALLNLEMNADFKLLIEENYIKEYSKELVINLGSDSMQLPEQQKLLLKAIEGIGAFANYINRIRNLGLSAMQYEEDNTEDENFDE